MREIRPYGSEGGAGFYSPFLPLSAGEDARRYRHLVGHGKRPPVAVTAIARELVGFIWAAMTQPASAA